MLLIIFVYLSANFVDFWNLIILIRLNIYVLARQYCALYRPQVFEYFCFCSFYFDLFSIEINRKKSKIVSKSLSINKNLRILYCENKY